MTIGHKSNKGSREWPLYTGRVAFIYRFNCITIVYTIHHRRYVVIGKSPGDGLIIC